MTTVAEQEPRTEAPKLPGILIPYSISPPIKDDDLEKADLEGRAVWTKVGGPYDQGFETILLSRDHHEEDGDRLREHGFTLTRLDPVAAELDSAFPDTVRGHETYGGCDTTHTIDVYRVLELSPSQVQEFKEWWPNVCEGYAIGSDEHGAARIALINDHDGKGQRCVEKFVQTLDNLEMRKWGSIQLTDLGDLWSSDVKTMLDQLDPAWKYEIVSELGDVFWND